MSLRTQGRQAARLNRMMDKLDHKGVQVFNLAPVFKPRKYGPSMRRAAGALVIGLPLKTRQIDGLEGKLVETVTGPIRNVI